MYPVSDDFKQFIYLSGRQLLAKIEVDLADGTHLTLGNSDIMENGIEIDDAVSNPGTFQVGAVIINQLTLILNNFENKFSGYDFTGAVIRPYIGLIVKKDWHGDTVEWVPKGVFKTDRNSSAGSRVTVTAFDNMAKLDAVYSKSTLAYPATLGQIAADACAVCGVTLATTAFPNSDYSVASRPSESSITCREILSYAAQLAGCFARCNTDGNMEIRWYEESNTLYDVGKDAVSSSVGDSDTVVTGVQIQGNDSSKTVYTSGTSGFMVRIKSNPLAQDGLQAIADALGAKFNGFSFRAYSAYSKSNPAIEAGDIVNMTDKKGVIHKSLVSKLNYEISGNEEFSAEAETASENQSERFSAAQKAQETADQAQAGVEEAKTEITQLNGQIILKADKGKLIAEINVSPEQIKIAAEKLELSGLVTIESAENGDTVINGKCIQTGRIESEDGSWWLDLETGKFYLSGGTFAGEAIWKDDNGHVIGSITCGGQAGLVIAGNEISIDGQSLSTPYHTDVKMANLSVGEINGVSLEEAYTGNVGIRMSNDTNRTLKFVNGILVDNDA